MPQEHNRKASTGTLGSGNGPTLRSGVTARPTHRVDHTAVRTDALLGALSAVEPGLNRYLQAEHDLQVEEDVIKGATAATQDNRSIEKVNADVKAGKIAPEQSAYFRRGYMTIHGRKAARDQVRLLREKMASGAFNSDTEDFEQFVAENSDDLSGLGDENYLAGYQQTLEVGLQNMREEDAAYQRKKVRDSIHEELSFSVQDIVDNQGMMNATELDAIKRDYAETFNIPKKEVEAVMLQTMERYADEGRPEVFDVFFEKRPDGTPGLGHHPEMGPQVAALQRKAKQIRRSTVDADRIKAREAWYRRAQTGDFKLRDLYANEEALAELFTPGEIESLLHARVRASTENLALQQYLMMFQNGKADFMPDGKVKNQAWAIYESHVLSQVGMPALEDGSPDYEALLTQADAGHAEALQAMAVLTGKLKENGHENPTWKDILTNTGQNGIIDAEGNISEDFLTGYKLSRQLKGTGLFRTHLQDEKTAQLYDTFDVLRRQYPEGVAAEKAWAIAYDTEFNQAVEARPDYQAIDEKVADLSDNWLSADALNTGTARMAIAKKAKTYIKAGAGADQAFEKAVADFQDEWINLDGRWVQNFSGQYAKLEPRMGDLRDLAMRKAGVDPEAFEDVRLTPDTNRKGTWWLVDTVGMPVAAPVQMVPLYNELTDSEKIKGEVRMQTANDQLQEFKTTARRKATAKPYTSRKEGTHTGIVPSREKLFEIAKEKYLEITQQTSLTAEDERLLWRELVLTYGEDVLNGK